MTSQNKVIDLRKVVKYFELDYFIVSETKTDESSLSQQFVTDNFEVRARKDRNCHGGGLIEIARKSFMAFICKKPTHQEPNNLERICSELTIPIMNGSATVSIDHPILKI